MHRDAVRKNCGAHSALAQIFEGVRDRRAGLFPSPARNPALHSFESHCHYQAIVSYHFQIRFCILMPV
jgi:hypothetical protein